MPSVRSVTLVDAPVVAVLWNHKTLDTQSCWYQAARVDAATVGGLLTAGYSLVLAHDGDTPLGFGLWCGPMPAPRLVALAADTDAVYYRLMAAFAAWGLAGGATTGYAQVDARSTTERARMDALGVITYRAIGYEALVEGADPAQRVPKLFRAECSLAVLGQRLAEILEGPA
jgi:hypothetical protein